MEVIRYINGQRIPGDLPVMTVENQRLLQIMKEIEMKASKKPARTAKTTGHKLEPRL